MNNLSARYTGKCPVCESKNVELDNPEWNSDHYERINVEGKCVDCGCVISMSTDVSMMDAPIWSLYDG